MLTKEELEKNLDPWPLEWISRERLTSIVTDLVKEATPKTSGLRYKNKLDPFSAIFDMAMNQTSFEEWFKQEIRRQQQKTMQNAIGKLHQQVLGSIAGWEDCGVGHIIDLQNAEKKIFAEVKNKFNTVKASDQYDLYDTLAQQRTRSRSYEGFTGYYVQIIAKETMNRPFTPSNHKHGSRIEPNEAIREIDGVSFYTLATGCPTALADLYKVLPYVLQEVCPDFDAKAVVTSESFMTLFEETFSNK